MISEILYMRENLGNINIGVDMDGTLTREVIGKDIMTLGPKKIEKVLINCSPKDGIDILLETNHNIFIITGRQERYRQVTTDWLDMYGIPYEDISMFPNNFYMINGYSIPKYVGLKLDMHVEKDIHLAFDDNIDVVNRFNEFGIKTSIVTDNFKDAFYRALGKVIETKEEKEND